MESSVQYRCLFTVCRMEPSGTAWESGAGMCIFCLSPASRKYTSHPLHGFPSIYYRILQIQARHFPQKHRRPVYPGYPPGLSLKGRYPLVARQK